MKAPTSAVLGSLTGPEQWVTDTWNPNSHLYLDAGEQKSPGLDSDLLGFNTIYTKLSKNSRIFYPSTTVKQTWSIPMKMSDLTTSSYATPACLMYWEVKHVQKIQKQHHSSAAVLRFRCDNWAQMIYLMENGYHQQS